MKRNRERTLFEDSDWVFDEEVILSSEEAHDCQSRFDKNSRRAEGVYMETVRIV